MHCKQKLDLAFAKPSNNGDGTDKSNEEDGKLISHHFLGSINNEESDSDYSDSMIKEIRAGFIQRSKLYSFRIIV